MKGWNYYLLSFLPALGELGSPSPLPVAELLNIVDVSQRLSSLIKTLVLGEDLLQREAHLAGEIEQPSVAVLTVEQATNNAPLPDYLTPQEDASSLALVNDRTWDTYYRYASSMAKHRKSAFVSAWIAREIALRNTFSASRAKALGMEPQPYLVAEELADKDADFSPLLSEWARAATPLLGLRLIEEERWSWLSENSGYYTFEDDEVLAYAARLLVLRRWHRVAQAAPNRFRAQYRQ